MIVSVDVRELRFRLKYLLRKKEVSFNVTVSGPTPSTQTSAQSSTNQPGMVSRRAIISRSRDDLQYHLGVSNKNFTGEDQWFSKEKLYKVCLKY